MLPRITGRELRFRRLAHLQPYLWFAGMSLFSISYHIAGLRGLPRRVYSASLNGEYSQWHGLSLIAAAGAVVLLLSALCYVTVTTATWLTGRKAEAPKFEFAIPPQPAVAGVWDRFGIWTVVAIVVVAPLMRTRSCICCRTIDMDRRRSSRFRLWRRATAAKKRI